MERIYLFLFFCSAFSLTAQKQEPALMEAKKAFALMTAEQAQEAKAYALGFEAVTWSMQWVKAAEAFHMQTAPLAASAERSPYDPQPHAMNVWGHARELLTSDIRLIETPNTETLYSVCLVDLSQGPVIVLHPDFGSRYYRSSIWDLHSDTHTISQKKDGGKPEPYLIFETGWKGELPKGVKAIEVRSRYVTIAPHIAVFGEDDLADVNKLQQGLKLIRLKDWGRSNKILEPGEPMRPLRPSKGRVPSGLLYFEELCEVLKDMHIREDELGFARQLKEIGIVPGESFNIGKLDPAVIKGLERAVIDAQAVISHDARNLAEPQKGGTWQVPSNITSLDNWSRRASVGYGYVWGDLDTEILYGFARTDDSKQPLTGQNRYELTFPKGMLPPAKYWRISMYDLNGFFVDNPIRRYGFGNMAEKAQLNPDGSITVYIQHESPEQNKKANWLPAPADGFFLVIRLYQPEEKMYKGDYILPAVSKVK